MQVLFAKAFVRSLAGVAAMATLPLMQRGAVAGWKHGSRLTRTLGRKAANRACALKHAHAHFRKVANDLDRHDMKHA